MIFEVEYSLCFIGDWDYDVDSGYLDGTGYGSGCDCGDGHYEVNGCYYSEPFLFSDDIPFGFGHEDGDGRDFSLEEF